MNLFQIEQLWYKEKAVENTTAFKNKLIFLFWGFAYSFIISVS